MEKLITVVLDKGVGREPKRFKPELRARAIQRANALADLHATGWTMSPDGSVLYVWAANWYHRNTAEGNN